MIRVLLADDETMVRAGVRAILGSDGGTEVVAEAGDGREAVELTRAHRPDVALLDIRMPCLDGLAAAEEIVRTVPGTAVAMLTTFSEGAYVTRALGGGATGFLLKSGDPYELIAGVKAVAAGAAFLSPKVARYVIGEGLGGRPSPPRGTRPGACGGPEPPGTRGARPGRRGPVQPGDRRPAAPRGGHGEGVVSAVLNRLGVRNRVQAAIVAYEAGLVRVVAAGEGAAPGSGGRATGRPGAACTARLCARPPGLVLLARRRACGAAGQRRASWRGAAPRVPAHRRVGVRCDGTADGPGQRPPHSRCGRPAHRLGQPRHHPRAQPYGDEGDQCAQPEPRDDVVRVVHADEDPGEGHEQGERGRHHTGVHRARVRATAGRPRSWRG